MSTDTDAKPTTVPEVLRAAADLLERDGFEMPTVTFDDPFHLPTPPH